MNHEKDVLSSVEINREENANSEVTEEIRNDSDVVRSDDIHGKDTCEDDVNLRRDTLEAVLMPSRRVSFPKSDSDLVTGYLEPANPWESVSVVKTVSELSELYTASCKKHSTEPLKSVLDHLQALELSKSMRQSCLSLKNNILTPDACEALEEVLKRVQYELIDLSECQLNDTAASALFDMIEYYEAANQLDISGNPDISSRGLQSCISMIRRSRALQLITIRGTPLSEANASNLGKSLNNSFLHTIKLEHCGLTGRPIAALCNALKKNNTLKELWLAHNDLSAGDAERLAELLRSNGYLEFLDISNNSIKDLGVRYIVKALIEQSTNIEEDNSKSNRDTIEEALSGNSRENVKPTLRNINTGRSMLDTLLTMNTKSPTVEIEKSDDDGWDFGQKDDEKSEELKISEEIFTSFADKDQACSDKGGNEVELELGKENVSPVRQPNPLISTNNNEYSVCDVSHTTDEAKEGIQTKAVDFNKNTKIDEMETSSDSAFESASEGDTRFKEAPKLNNYKQMEFEADLYTKEPIVGNENLSDSGITLSESRLRSLSSDSLSSENSLDTSDTNLLDKINEKITKNDTLTRQKHIEEPLQSTKRPKGLQALVLWNNSITRESGEFISDLLATTNSLELLNIGKNILSNDFIVKIEGSLKANSTVTNLGLQSSHLSCAGIKTLSSILQFGGNCTLQRIDIRDNNLQVEGLSCLVEALKSNKSVTRVDVDDVPKRILDGANDMQFHYSRVLHTLRSLCSKNDNSQESLTLTNNIKKTGLHLTSRKISLTCPSIRTPILEQTMKMDQLSVDIKKKSSVRLRSPLPSPPTASPSSSPVPSPSRSRFQVFRVAENKTPSNSDSKTVPKEVPKCSNSFKSRFHVTLVKSSDITDPIPIVGKVANFESNTGNDIEKREHPAVPVNTFDRSEVSESTTTATEKIPALSDPEFPRTAENNKSVVTSDLPDNLTTDSIETSDGTCLEKCSSKEDSVESQNLPVENPNMLEVVANQTPVSDSSEETRLESDEKSSQGGDVDESKEIGEFNTISNSTWEMGSVLSIKSLETNTLTNNSGCSVTFFESSNQITNTCSTNDSIAQNTLNQGSLAATDLIENKYLTENSSESAVENKQSSEEEAAISTTVTNNQTTISEMDCIDCTNSTIEGQNLDYEPGSEQLKLFDNSNETTETKIDPHKTEGEPRTRKSSWISTSGCPTTVDKLLSLFQHPANLFARTSSPERERKPEDSEATSQSLVSVRKQSPPGGLFSWHKTSNDPKIVDVKRLSTENIINSGFQASFLDVASKQIRGIADFGKQVFRQNISFGEAVNAEPPQSCESIPTEVKLEIKENISPEHTITPNSIAFFQTIQQDTKTAVSVQSDNEEKSQSVHPTSAQSGKLTHDADLGDLMSSDIAGNNL